MLPTSARYLCFETHQLCSVMMRGFPSHTLRFRLQRESLLRRLLVMPRRELNGHNFEAINPLQHSPPTISLWLHIIQSGMIFCKRRSTETCQGDHHHLAFQRHRGDLLYTSFLLIFVASIGFRPNNNKSSNDKNSNNNKSTNNNNKNKYNENLGIYNFLGAK